ncbi:hypothetical protein NCAS_0G01820 [Naumovozyma castellii]|uniref:non-specific serine/threonine protein kinase n=1 Tax=Naumovozyma castellii TaxID=27288 RepID=G0VI35_NAUCA|nr:hypothetical protein NCAS_0G01820 [Naumovozyma castellii CBS 4309]CCC71069.1 hypothetical protein NCAS_0G01820 [Naumovozyma castellii CBS 4309]
MSSLTKLLQEKRKNDTTVNAANSNTLGSQHGPSLLRTTSKSIGIPTDRNNSGTTTSVTTVVPIESEDDESSSSMASSSFDGKPMISSSFLTANFAHTAHMYSRERSGSFINNYNHPNELATSLGSNSALPARRNSRHYLNGSASSNRQIPSLSSSIPYAVPNSNKDTSANGNHSASSSLTSSWLESYGSSMPNNISAIDSNIITSPVVNSVEPRFVISKQKLQKSAQENSNNASASVSRSSSFSSQLGNLFFSKSSKDIHNSYSPSHNNTNSTSNGSSTNNSNTYHVQSNASSADSAKGSIAGNSIPKPMRARQYSSSRQQPPSGTSYTDHFFGSPTSVQDVHPHAPPIQNQSLPRSHNSSIGDLKRFFKKTSSTNSLHASSNSNSGIMMGSPPVTNGIPVPNSNNPTSLNRMPSANYSPHSYGDTIYSTTNNATLPFSKRYLKTGDDLGAGAGGSVKLVKRLSDKKIFAVKEFRAKFENETKRDYVKKITSEYCIGTTLNNPNIIETIEIVYENERILQVMEYCDYDLFAIVMSNKMSYEEICCCFKQILTGVQYLHSIGLAHRDLKLDNCVINEKGIVKLIDFGAAVVFSYPFSKTLVEASGIVGSDPYLAPEVCIFSKYDPRPVDIWSTAIIFACMILKKFPWKIPKLRDNSFKLFCSGRDCDSLSALVTRTPDPPSYDNSMVQIPEEKPSHSSHNVPDPSNPNIGPQRLLHSLPEETHHIINRMVDLAPACRANIDEIMNDEWIRNIEMCHMIDDGFNRKLVHASDHTHTQVDQSEAHIAGLEKKKKQKQEAADSQ